MSEEQQAKSIFAEFIGEISGVIEKVEQVQACKTKEELVDLVDGWELEKASLKAQVKELEQKLSQFEWKPASEAVEGREYDVCGGEYLHYSEYSDYDEWSQMTSDVAVARCEKNAFMESSFTGEYADEYGARWYYRPKWVRERPTPPSTQEALKNLTQIGEEMGLYDLPPSTQEGEE